MTALVVFMRLTRFALKLMVVSMVTSANSPEFIQTCHEINICSLKPITEILKGSGYPTEGAVIDQKAN